jgi:hypothetical protein
LVHCGTAVCLPQGRGRPALGGPLPIMAVLSQACPRARHLARLRSDQLSLICLGCGCPLAILLLGHSTVGPNYCWAILLMTPPGRPRWIPACQSPPCCLCALFVSAVRGFPWTPSSRPGLVGLRSVLLLPLVRPFLPDAHTVAFTCHGEPLWRDLREGRLSGPRVRGAPGGGEGKDCVCARRVQVACLVPVTLPCLLALASGHSSHACGLRHRP